MSGPVGDRFSINGKQLPIREAWQVGEVLFLSGQLAFGAGGKLVGDDIGAQTHQVVANIEAVLKKANLGIEDIFKVTVWLQNIEDFAAFNVAYGEHFGEDPPARSAIRADLLVPGALLEMEVMAKAPE